MSESPSRPLANAMRVLSGDQAGSKSKPGEVVRRRSPVPSAFIT
jgi:hypothetical protein